MFICCICTAQNGGAIPFNTQFFHDDYDDAPGFDDVYDADGGDVITAAVEPGEQDLLALSQGQRRRVRPERVNYAKRAKRVDVRKLKDNIWKSLDIVVPESEQPEEDAMVCSRNGFGRDSITYMIVKDLDDRPVESRPVTDPAESRVFDNVISGLQKSYPKDKMDEISTSFCFICLLHLANERGLKLESGNEDTIIPDDAEDKKVGNIWDLKVSQFAFCVTQMLRRFQRCIVIPTRLPLHSVTWFSLSNRLSLQRHLVSLHLLILHFVC